MCGYDFDRQRPIDEYIIDFYCKDLMLAIEIDGDSHDHPEVAIKDVTRQKRLEQLGVHVLRFCDEEVRNDIENVLWGIEGWIIEHEPTPSPSQEENSPLTPPRRGNPPLAPPRRGMFHP